MPGGPGPPAPVLATPLDSERLNILHNLKQSNCQYEFVFVSPEAVITDNFLSCLTKLSSEGMLSFFIIDEAHCINTWGAEFQPAYQRLNTLRKFNVPVAALTGTATEQTLDAIKSTMQMNNPLIVRMPCRRSNLVYSVVEKKETKSKQQICTIITEEYPETCGIIYCATQSDTVEMAFVLKQHCVTATFYHAGVESGDRMRNASLWLSNKVNVMCCTNAFGMGIDKKDVRFTMHLSMPSSLEDYVQDSGRGGRDGKNCSYTLLFRFEDRTFHLRNLSRLTLEQERENKIHLLNSITEFCMEYSVCRQQVIAKYFSEDVGETCKSCDVCQKGVVHEVKDYTQEAKNVIECLSNLNYLNSKVKINQLVMTYMGSKAKGIITNGFHAVPQYGKGKTTFHSCTYLTKFVQHLIFKGFVKENIQNIENRISLTYIGVGNVVNLLNNECKVFF